MARRNGVSPPRERSEEVYRDGERMKKIQARNADLKAMIGLLSVKWETLSREREQLEGAVA